ncbi:hypothetical protein KIPB_010007, partial [Kipferlia bialata]|eukprot:g10007.t1
MPRIQEIPDKPCGCTEGIRQRQCPHTKDVDLNARLETIYESVRALHTLLVRPLPAADMLVSTLDPGIDRKAVKAYYDDIHEQSRHRISILVKMICRHETAAIHRLTETTCPKLRRFIHEYRQSIGMPCTCHTAEIGEAAHMLFLSISKMESEREREREIEEAHGVESRDRAMSMEDERDWAMSGCHVFDDLVTLHVKIKRLIRHINSGRPPVTLDEVMDSDRHQTYGMGIITVSEGETLGEDTEGTECVVLVRY